MAKKNLRPAGELADELGSVAMRFKELALELADLDDRTDEDGVKRAQWLQGFVGDLLEELKNSKLYATEAWRMHASLLNRDEAELAKKVGHQNAQAELAKMHGETTKGVRDALTDIRRVKAGKAPLKKRTRKLRQK